MSLKSMKMSTKYAAFSGIVVVLCVLITAFVCLLQTRADLLRQARGAVDTRMKVLWELVLSKDNSVAMGDAAKEPGKKLAGKPAELAKRIENAKFTLPRRTRLPAAPCQGRTSRDRLYRLKEPSPNG
jgi:hypothetical protein